MESKNIASITVKEIFENMMDEENASKVLSSIQQEYDKGTRGDELVEFAKKEIEKHSSSTRFFGFAAVASILIF